MRNFIALIAFPILAGYAAQRADHILDESKVPPYTIPDPLVCLDGSKVADAQTWMTKRRPELLELYRSQMHGRSPQKPAELKFQVSTTSTSAFNGLATRKEISMLVGSEPDAPVVHILLYIPNSAKQVPAIVGGNFDGNHTISTDPDVPIRDQWWWDNIKKQDFLKAPRLGRASAADTWQLETILKRGYALATFYRGDVEPDYPQGWKHGLRGYFLKKSGKAEFAPDDWGTIGAWAWTLSRTLDYLESDPSIDSKHVVVFGHSRLGKTALWAGATDERFALVISNNSGECGASLSKRVFGETIEDGNTTNPHWFNANFKQYDNHPERLQFDAHELIALSAPRPIYIASAELDIWADPQGEFLAAKAAEPVYRLFGKDGVGCETQPQLNHACSAGFIAYHIRTGKHSVTAYDWEQYLAYADRHFGRK